MKQENYSTISGTFRIIGEHIILKIIPLIVALMACHSTFAQQSSAHRQKCNLETVSNLHIHKDSLTDKLIMDFLYSIDKSCKNDAEWSEASNGALFWLADVDTKRFIQLMVQHKKELDTKQIIAEFKQPIAAGTDLAGTYKKIAALGNQDELVYSILYSIRSAATTSGVKIY